jgi:hypothetical protein
VCLSGAADFTAHHTDLRSVTLRKRPELLAHRLIFRRKMSKIYAAIVHEAVKETTGDFTVRTEEEPFARIPLQNLIDKDFFQKL